MDSNIAIEIREMNKDFKRVYDKPQTMKERALFWNRNKPELFHVLKNINLDIKKGESVALIGTNGSGKSTLLKLMTKILYPTNGEVKTFGKLTSLLELGAGFHPDFTGRENIYFNASIFGLTREEIEKRIDEIIIFSELGDFIDNPIRTYSSGMYMRLAFSIAINVDAEILLIDEILAVGDQHFQDKCFDKLKELKNSDKTIVIVSHSLGVVKDLCDRAIWIYKGEFKLDGEPTYVIDEYLKQVKLDHKEEKKKAIESGVEEYQGMVFVDSPKAFAPISKGSKKMVMQGWSLSDCENSYIKCYFDNQELSDIHYSEREDVYLAYHEQYGAFVNKDKIGFSCTIAIEDVQIGNHVIRVAIFDHNDILLKDKEVSIKIIE